jgi:hypothetical protein
VKIKIDPEFAALIPAVPADEDAELEQAILSDGKIFEPLILWKHQNTLLDGHRRHRLMNKHPQLKAPKPELLDLETRDDAHNWIIDHQLSKRNVNEAQRRYLIGKKYLERKKPHGGEQVVTVTTCPKTAEKVASEHGISEKSVRNAAEFAEAVDAVAESAPEVKNRVLSGEVSAKTSDLEALAELPKRQQEKAASAISNGKVTSVGAAVKAAKPKRGQPTVDVRCFADLESQIGKAVRANTACKEKCGGAKFHEQIRQLFNQALKVLAEWRKSA